MKKTIPGLFLLCFVLLACNRTQTINIHDTKPIDKKSNIEMPKEIVKSIGLDLTMIDPSVRPQDNFFRHVNGKWLDEVAIPADRGRWGSFDELRKRSTESVLEVLEESIASGKYGESTDQFKASAFYKSGMDQASINATGINPLLSFFAKIDAIGSLADVQKYNQETSWAGNRGFFGFAVFPDLMNSSINVAYLTAGSIGLPEREYYLKDDVRSIEIRDKYVAHISRMFEFIGVNKEMGLKKAKTILQLETKIASNMLSKEDSRNPLNIYNLRSVKEVSSKTKSINWNGYFKAIGVGEIDTIIVMDANYFNGLEDILTYTPISIIKDYLKWNELNNSASYLSADIERANFDFFSTELSGVKEMRPRYEKVLNLLSGIMGEAVGKLYVDKYFPPDAKASAAEMVANILGAYENRIKNLEWMTPATKEKALDKLNSFTVKIGYPDKWKDYSTMSIKSVENGGSFIENVIAASKWQHDDMISKMGKEVDKTEWGMSPQTVNAYYNPLNNEIVFPAAILQPPFYNYKADAPVNYGGIGAVIGHEISHGFDDQGSRFDASGNMVNWWTEDDRTQFDDRNKKLIEQFDSYEALPGLFVNGTFTLGENIGDLGGIHAAYDGLQKHFANHGKQGLSDGLSPEQRFFYSWATIWRGKMRDEELRKRIQTDPHSPGNFRAIGPLSNMDAFYKSFDLKEGDEMYRKPENRVKIW